MPWATPTVKGFMKAAVKPAPAPARTMATPVMESNPKARARGTMTGMKGRVSSAMPKMQPPMAKMAMTTGMMSRSRPCRALVTAPMEASMAPVA